MVFGFMRASALDYSWPDKSKDHVVQSFDGYSPYLLIVDEASRFVWIFLTASKVCVASGPRSTVNHDIRL